MSIILDDEFYAQYPALAHPDDLEYYEYEATVHNSTQYLYPQDPAMDLPF